MASKRRLWKGISCVAGIGLGRKANAGPLGRILFHDDIGSGAGLVRSPFVKQCAAASWEKSRKHLCEGNLGELCFFRSTFACFVVVRVSSTKLTTNPPTLRLRLFSRQTFTVPTPVSTHFRGPAAPGRTYSSCPENQGVNLRTGSMFEFHTINSRLRYAMHQLA